MSEIGSEYWAEIFIDTPPNKSFNSLVNFGKDQTLLFSGRTAIDYILQDLPFAIKSVYMPSYCCISMLQPFIDRGINIEFYYVVPDEKGLRYVVDYTKEVDVFFAMSYFGFHGTAMDHIIDVFRKTNTIVIEDITHRLLCFQNHSEKSHYYVASLRKWFPIPSGGIAIKKEGTFRNIDLKSPPESIINKKVSAMRKKASFINNQGKGGAKCNKDEFLSLFSDFNANIPLYYKNTRIDCISEKYLSKINIENIRIMRRKNAEYIYENLRTSMYSEFLMQKIDTSIDCPLFVPIKVSENMRDSLKQHLIKNNIYCPVHWPIPNIEGIVNNSRVKLYNQELSLVCDHRYSQRDMKRMVDIIEEFVNTI